MHIDRGFVNRLDFSLTSRMSLNQESFMRRWPTDRFVFILWLGLAPIASAQEAPGAISDQELLDELKAAPATNPERVEKLKALFEQAGAPPESIRLQAVEPRREGDPVSHNVIMTKPGTTDDVIVIGGHLDKVEPGDGVIDDWSGASMTTNLYQVFKSFPTDHTMVFIGFAYEEQGLLGSRLYVNSLTVEERSKVKAMVNLECLGVGGPFVWSNGSTDSLERLAHKVAEQAELPLKSHVILGVGADSIPFERAGIATITFDGLPLDQMHLIHSPLDTFEQIDPECYIKTFQLVSRFLVALDRQPEGVAEEQRDPD
ncbi:hypothetical protein BH23PLA1_BH23PLA1_33740 [soil metagenome]